MLETLVSLMVGLLSNALWFAAERIGERIRTRKNPPRDEQSE